MSRVFKQSQKAAVDNSFNKLYAHSKSVHDALKLNQERIFMRKEEIYSLHAHHYIIDNDTSQSNNLVKLS